MKLLATIMAIALTQPLFAEDTVDSQSTPKKHNNNQEAALKIGEVSASSKYVKVPEPLAKKIEHEYLKKYKESHKNTQKTDVEILNEIGVEFLNFHVVLEQDKHLALDREVRFELPRGGGVVDLATYVRGKVGNFWIKFLSKEDDLNINKNFSAYFVSQSIKRDLDGKVFGSGCDSYFDVTSFFKKTLKKGIKLNATDQRYLSVAAGSFHFIYNDGKKLKLSTISFTDSRYPYLLCK